MHSLSVQDEMLALQRLNTAYFLVVSEAGREWQGLQETLQVVVTGGWCRLVQVLHV
jgi:hypothetical protein